MEEEVKNPITNCYIDKNRAEKIADTIEQHIQSLFAECGATLRKEIKEIRISNIIEVHFKKKLQASKHNHIYRSI